jgi:hypothetical protein
MDPYQRMTRRHSALTPARTPAAGDSIHMATSHGLYRTSVRYPRLGSFHNEVCRRQTGTKEALLASGSRDAGSSEELVKRCNKDRDRTERGRFIERLARRAADWRRSPSRARLTAVRRSASR